MSLSVRPNERFVHNDSYGIKQSFYKSTPPVSDFGDKERYIAYMPQIDTWKSWGRRFRIQIKEKGKNLAKVAERMDLAESTIRSWTNGTREINLSDFFRLCEAGGVDPAHVLFGKIGISAEQRKALGTFIDKLLDADPAGSTGFQVVEIHTDKTKRRA
jgi:transcriptional regulator with XRE-family HTH domain